MTYLSKVLLQIIVATFIVVYTCSCNSKIKHDESIDVALNLPILPDNELLAIADTFDLSKIKEEAYNIASGYLCPCDGYDYGWDIMLCDFNFFGKDSTLVLAAMHSCKDYETMTEAFLKCYSLRHGSTRKSVIEQCDIIIEEIDNYFKNTGLDTLPVLVLSRAPESYLINIKKHDAESEYYEEYYNDYYKFRDYKWNPFDAFKSAYKSFNLWSTRDYYAIHYLRKIAEKYGNKFANTLYSEYIYSLKREDAFRILEKQIPYGKDGCDCHYSYSPWEYGYNSIQNEMYRCILFDEVIEPLGKEYYKDRGEYINYIKK